MSFPPTLSRGLPGLVLLFVLAACTADDASPSVEIAVSPLPVTEERVTVRDLAFSPQELTVTTGTTVTWVNEDERGHTITHGTGGAPTDSPAFDVPLSADQTVSYTFTEVGTYPVTCTVHHDMQMTVIVQGP